MLEPARGILPILGLLPRPDALALAGNMAVAIATAGRIGGGTGPRQAASSRSVSASSGSRRPDTFHTTSQSVS